MNRRLAELARRRQALHAAIEAQRAELAATAARWEAPLRIADAGVATIRYVRNHPGLVAGLAAAALVLRRRNVWRLVDTVGILLRQNPAVSGIVSRLLSGLLRARRREETS